MSVLGAAAVFVYCFFTNRSGRLGRIKTPEFLHLCVLNVIAIILGAKLLYAITLLPAVIADWPLYAQDPLRTLSIMFSGMVYYGGILAAVGVTYWYCRRYKVDFPTVAAIFMPAVPLFHAFGRVGCFLTGCCWGVECEALGITFTHALAAPNGVPLFPIQLVEAGLNLLLFLVLATAVRRMRRRGDVLPLYFLLYAVMRFVLEFFRGDELRGVWLLSTSQWISLAILLVLLIYAVRRRARRT